MRGFFTYFPNSVFLKGSSLPACSLHLQQLSSIPILRTSPPKLYLTSWSQTVFKPCPTSSKVTLQSTSYKDLFGSAFHHRGTQGLSPAGCCPQYTRQPAEGSLSYGERRQRSERWGERETGWAVRGAAGDAGRSGARAGGSSPRQDSRRGIASRHLLYHFHTQLSRLHYLHVVCFCF